MTEIYDITTKMKNKNLSSDSLQDIGKDLDILQENYEILNNKLKGEYGLKNTMDPVYLDSLEGVEKDKPVLNQMKDIVQDYTKTLQYFRDKQMLEDKVVHYC